MVERFEELTSDVPKEERKPLPDDIDRRQRKKKHIEAKTVRVHLSQLDSLMDIAGELAIQLLLPPTFTFVAS